jgi:hypothetical protein
MDQFLHRLGAEGEEFYLVWEAPLSPAEPGSKEQQD